MKRMKSLLALVLALLLTFALAACGGGTASSAAPAGDASAPAADDAAEPASTGGEASGDLLHVGIVTSSGVDDGSFGQDCYNGILGFIEANPGATENHVKEPDVGKVVQAVADVIADYDAMVMPGFQFNASGPIAQDNPDKYFILVDAYPVDADGNDLELDNMYAMQFKEQESGFLAGIAAAMETKSGKVAVVNGMAFPSNVNYQFGFMSGVNYANAHLDATAEIVELPSYAGTDVNGENVGGNYIGAFADQATGKLVGEALIAEGVDIMLVAAGDSGNGVFAAVKEAGDDVFVIGCDVDQYDDGETGSRNIVLTSALKVMAPQVTLQLQKAQDGSFKGENALLGASDGATGLVVDDGRHQLTSETIDAVNTAFEGLVDGSIVPAANFNGNKPDNFPGL